MEKLGEHFLAITIMIANSVNATIEGNSLEQQTLYIILAK